MRIKLIFLKRAIILFIGLWLIFIYHYIISISIDNSSFFLPYNISWSENENNFIDQEFKPLQTKCDGNFIQYKNKFVVIKNVLIDKTCAFGLPGGENIKSVLEQNEQSEFYKYLLGFISIPCSDFQKENIIFPLGVLNHINDFYSSLSYFPPYLLKFVPKNLMYNKTVLFVTRNEYANFYHTITDFYVIFIIRRILRLRRSDIHVVLTDGHPGSSLDNMWFDLFPNLSRLSQFSTLEFVLIDQLVWIPFGYIAPIMQLHWHTAPMLQDFRDDILSAYKMPTNGVIYSCQHISILFVWRHNYLAHPRNPSGDISRKISNEKQIVSHLFSALQSDSFLLRFNISIKEAQLEQLPMRRQLDVITRTSILIGMHGAGLTHALFLPRGAGLIEVFPLYYDDKNTHFKAISKWRNLHYEFYANKNSNFEIGKFLTFVPPVVIIEKVKSILQKFSCIPSV